MSIRNGMLEYDTLNYHMPFAAHFAQDASITRLVYVGDASVSFYPMNSELIHAAGILLLQREVISGMTKTEQAEWVAFVGGARDGDFD